MDISQDVRILDDGGPRAGRPDSVSAPLVRPSSPWLGHLLLVSLLFMLNLPLFFTLNTGMDQYSFYTLEPVSAFPMPAVLSTLLNLIMAALGFALYCWLWRRQGWFTGGSWSPFTRGAVLSAVPVVLAHAPAIALTVQGGKATQIAIAGLMAGSLTVTHALRDPETSLDQTLARYWFVGALATILTFLCLSVGAMLVLYSTEQTPDSGNLLWEWTTNWQNFGYPPEEFHQRWRNALTAFTISGSGFMIVVLGGSMLGAILRWTRKPQYVEQPSPSSRRYQDATGWAKHVILQLDSLSPFALDEAEYVAVFDGYAIDITLSQYESLVGGKADLLRDAGLFINKVSGDVLLRSGGTWTRLDFRVRRRGPGIRSGPFALLCVYARHPARRFTNGELETLIQNDLAGDRTSMNVGEFISQLQRGGQSRPGLPVQRDGTTSYLDAAVNVCLLDHRRASRGPVESPRSSDALGVRG